MQTVPVAELSSLRMVAGNEKKYSIVIDGDEIREWVGIGWIPIGTPTSEDRAKYPTVVRPDDDVFTLCKQCSGPWRGSGFIHLGRCPAKGRTT